MNDDFIDDGDFGNGDDFMDDPDFMDDSDCSFGMDDSLNDEMQDDSKDEDTTDIGWEEIAMAGSLSEEISESEKRRRRIERKMNKDKDQNDI